MDRQLTTLRRGYRDEQRTVVRDAMPKSPNDDRNAPFGQDRELGCAGADAGTSADALGLEHVGDCTDDHPVECEHGLLACWRCYYVDGVREN